MQPWLTPGVNYSAIHHAPQYCQEDGGVWNETGKWCNPVKGSKYTTLWHNTMEHNHNAIGWSGGAPRGTTSSLKLMVSLALIAMAMQLVVTV